MKQTDPQPWQWKPQWRAQLSEGPGRISRPEKSCVYIRQDFFDLIWKLT